MSRAPDIRPGDFVRVYAGSGALRGDWYLLRSMVLEVLSVADPPGRPDWRYLSGRICRRDLSPAAQLQHTVLEVQGPERSILHLAGQWQLLHRPSPCPGTPHRGHTEPDQLCPLTEEI
jgi:hypothetical protein